MLTPRPASGAADPAGPSGPARQRRWLAPLTLLLAMAGGGLAAIATLGPRILDIDDLGWLLHGTLGPDPVAYWLGWRYFAATPWHWPPGLNPEYGLEIASAIFYVDAIPLGAFIAKALQPLVEVAQYWGPWLVLSAALQAGLAWCLLGVEVEDPLARGLGAMLFAWQPMMLNRMGGHFALVAHWLILWSLWLCLRRASRRQTLYWAACLGIAAAVNAYLLAMCAGLWVADWLGRALGGVSKRALALQAVVVPAVVLGALWLAGFYSLAGEMEPVGLRYGEAPLDLTAPFDPIEWGRFLPAVPGLRHWENGGSYLGAGVLLLIALALPAALRRSGRAARHRPVLLAMLACMLAFAISNHPGIGGVVVDLFDLPAPLTRLADMLRSSERFFWPLGYALTFAAIALLAARLRRPVLRLVLAAAVLVQVTDIEAGMSRFRALVAAAPPVAADRLPDPFWEEAASRYQIVRAVPTANFGRHWEPVARFAAWHLMPTDAVYLSRVDPARVGALDARLRQDIAVGAWDPDTLYILRDQAMREMVAARADPLRDLLATVDGITVFAPGWYEVTLPPIAGVGPPVSPAGRAVRMRHPLPPRRG